MIDNIKKFFGIGPHVNFASLFRQGAQIIDVRTPAEFQQGHIHGAINLPLNNLSNHYSRIKKDKPVITCCASGVRSSQAKIILQANGFTQVYNGGGWMSLKRKLKS